MSYWEKCPREKCLRENCPREKWLLGRNVLHSSGFIALSNQYNVSLMIIVHIALRHYHLHLLKDLYPCNTRLPTILQSLR